VKPPLDVSAWWRGAHLAVVWAFAVVQPLLELLGRNAEFFIARGNGAADLVVFGLAITLVPPLLLLGLEQLVAIASKRLQALLHLVFVGVLAGIFFLQVVDGLLDSGLAVLMGTATVLGALATLAYARAHEARLLLSFLSPAPLVFLVLFLCISDVAKIVLPEDEPEALAAGTGARPLVMVVFDELPTASLMTPEGMINDHRFPNFAALADGATWYPNATTVAKGTVEAVPSLLTGKLPDASLDPLLADYPDNLFTLLAGSVRLNVHEETVRLCPPRFCETDSGSLAGRLRSLVTDLAVVTARLVLPDALAGTLPSVNQGFSDFGGGEESYSLIPRDERNHGANPEAMALLLEGIRRDPRGLHFIHTLLPHIPWHLLPSGQSYGDGSIWNEFADRDALWPPDATGATERALAAHLLQLGYADLLLGKIMRAVRSAGIWQEATIVVTADHGGSFLPGTMRRKVESGTFGAIAPVPLLIKAPRQEKGRVDDRPMRAIDVLPTIADLLGIDMPFEVDGIPARRVNRIREISILNGAEDEPETAGVQETLAQRDEIVARIGRLFGLGWQGVYRYGPRPGLIGKRIDSLEHLEPDASESFSLSGSENYEQVDLEASFLPALLAGTPSGIPNGAAVAFAINGRIAATAEVYDSIKGPQQIAAVAPPRIFRDGANEVAVYRIVGFGLKPLAELGEE